MSIRAKVLFAIMLAVVLSIVGVTAMVSMEMNTAFVKNFRISSKAQLDRMDAFVVNFFESTASSAELLAASPYTLDNIDTITSYVDRTELHKPVGANLPPAERALFEELSRVQRAFPSYALVYVNNNKGGITQAPDDTLSAGFNPATRPWYIAAVKAGKTIITEAYISDSGGAVCTVATPVRAASGGGFRGVVALDISLATLTKEVGNTTVGKTGYVLLLDSLGQVIGDPRHSGADIPASQRWLGKTVDSLPGDAAAALTRLRGMKQGDAEVRIDGKAWLASVKTTGDGWSLIMLQEKAEVFADAMNVTMGILLVGIGIAAVMLVIAWFVARSIAGPVAVLASAAQSVATGNLEAIPEDERPFKGELGILHRSLRQMVAKLVELINTANSKMKEAEAALDQSRASLEEAETAKKQAELARREGIQQTAKQLSVVIEQLAAAAKRLANEAAQTGRLTKDQRTQVSGTAAAIVQMNAAVSDVAHSTSRTASLADEARNEARTGRTLVESVVSKMAEIEKQSLSMRDSLSGLGSQASDIGQIMGVINDIADQTNLLALNAAIEAARAGEAGRGFAVVADEVRKLAEKTMEATKQVGNAIHTIQQGTTNNMTAMQRAAEFISDSAQVASKAGKALADIESVVENTAGEVRAIATASEEQSATLEEINRSTEGINTITADVAESAERSNAAVQELSALSRKLTDVVAALQKGEELQQPTKGGEGTSPSAHARSSERERRLGVSAA